MLRWLLPDPFILGLVTALVLATVLPATGLAAQGVAALSVAMVVMLFFFVGAKLSRASIVEGIAHWRLHLIILSSTFVMFPLLALALSKALAGAFSPTLWTGVFFLAALPSTVQSSIALTSIARGNIAAAVAAASASQLLGIFLAPAIFSLLADVNGSHISPSAVGKIALEIFVPFITGHLARPWIADWVTRHKPLITITDRGTILVAVYAAFSAAVLEGIWNRLPPGDLLKLGVLCAIILTLALSFTYGLARALGFNREDRIAIVFCGTKKSLVQGVPMARVMFSGPDLGLILLPIMIFHQMQLMVCSAIARRFATGVSQDA